MRSTLTLEVTERIKMLYQQQGLSAGEITKLLVGEGNVVKHHQIRHVINKAGLTRTQSDAAHRRVKRLGRWFEKNKPKTCTFCQEAFTPKTVTQIYCQRCNRNGTLSAYGITADECDVILHTQDHACGVCGCDLSSLPTKQIHIDHDHNDGKIRGIVCRTCNWRLSAVDDSSWMQKALSYLSKPGHQPKIVGTVMRAQKARSG